MTLEGMILFDCRGAPSPKRARMFLAEKRVEIDVRQVSLRTREQLGEAFLKVNPRATVPVLITPEGVALTENLAIAEYIEAILPEPPLLGRTAEERGLISMWNTLSERDGLFAFSDAVRNTSTAMRDRAITGPVDFAQIPALAELGKQRLELFYRSLDRQLEGRQFVASEMFSIADITAYVTVEAATAAEMAPAHDLTNLSRWFKTVASRPSAAT